MRIGKVHKQISWRGEKKTPTGVEFNVQAEQTPAEVSPFLSVLSQMTSIVLF